MHKKTQLLGGAWSAHTCFSREISMEFYMYNLGRGPMKPECLSSMSSHWPPWMWGACWVLCCLLHFPSIHVSSCFLPMYVTLLAVSNTSHDIHGFFLLLSCCFCLWFFCCCCFLSRGIWTAFDNRTSRLFYAFMPNVYIFHFIILFLRLWRLKKLVGVTFFFQMKVKGRREHVTFISSNYPCLPIFLDLRIGWLWWLTVRCEDTA